MASQLFSPLKIKDIKLPNRIVIAPMCQYSAKEGVPTDWHLMHLGQFSVSGAGLVFAEATAVEAIGRTEAVQEQFFLITASSQVERPLLAELIARARGDVFEARAGSD